MSEDVYKDTHDNLKETSLNWTTRPEMLQI